MKKELIFLCNGGRDIHYPTNESKPTHVESLSQGKPYPGFFKLGRRYGAILFYFAT